MKTIKMGLAVIAFLVSVNIHAGQDGNGGDVRICRDAATGTTKIELYDVYEARRNRGINPNFSAGLTYEQKVEEVLRRIGKYDYKKEELYRGWWNDLSLIHISEPTRPY